MVEKSPRNSSPEAAEAAEDAPRKSSSDAAEAVDDAPRKSSLEATEAADDAPIETIITREFEDIRPASARPDRSQTQSF